MARHHSALARLYTTTRADAPFQVVYLDPIRREKSGRAKRVVKWFADRPSAEAYRQRTSEGLLVEGGAGLHFDAHVRADALSARALLDEGGHRRITLRSLAEAYTARVTHHAAGEERIGDAVAEFLREKEHAEGRAPLTVRNLRHRLWRWIDAQGVQTVGDVTREQIEPVRTRAECSPQTRKNDLAAISAFCTHLVDRRKIDQHPIKGLRRPHVPWRRPVIYTAAECARLLAATAALPHDSCLAAVVVMLFAGLRPSELAQARILYGRRPAVRAEGGKLRGRANRLVPLPPAAVAWLALGGKPTEVREWSRHARGRALAAAGLTWTVDVLRHTFISHRTALVGSTAQVAREAGTSEAMIFRHYQSLVTAAEARQWSALRPAAKN